MGQPNGIQAPSAKQEAMAKRAQEAFTNEFAILHREGVILPALLAGLAAVAADMVASSAGDDAVAPWFEANAELWRKSKEEGR